MPRSTACADEDDELPRAPEQVSFEEIDYLTVEDLLEIAAGVLDEVAVRDAGLLAAQRLDARWSRSSGPTPIPPLDDKAAALLHSLVRNHALVDGNKRLAWAAARVFCILNGRDLTYSVDEAEALMLAAAAGGLDVPQLALWVRAHSR
ncbi:MAG: Fic family protein [Nocardioidaceae bacterium]